MTMKPTFSEIVKAVCSTYHIDACCIADHLSLEDEVVEGWMEGTSIPTKENLIDFVGAFVIPLKTLEDSLNQQEEKEKHE